MFCFLPEEHSYTSQKKQRPCWFFYCIQCTFGTPSPCLSGAKLQNKELSASSSVDFHIQAQGLNRWPWRQSLMPSFRKSVTLYALFFPPSAVFLSHSKSQSARLIVEYAFTHHWFFFSLSSVTLQLHLHIPCFVSAHSDASCPPFLHCPFEWYKQLSVFRKGGSVGSRCEVDVRKSLSHIEFSFQRALTDKAGHFYRALKLNDLP